MPEIIKVNVVSYGGVKPGQVVGGNTKEGEKTIMFDAATSTDGSYRFYNVSSLTSWTVDLPNLTSGSNMFSGCSGLTSWNVDLPNLTNGTNMFYHCSGLTSWNVDLPNLTSGSNMFSGCSGLTSWNGELPNLTNGYGMFLGCKLDAESVKLILSSIPDRASAGLGVASLHIGKRANFNTDPDVASLLGTVTPIGAGTYSCKGWDVSVQD